MTPTISFMTANFVARETGWRMRDWGEGDRATQAAFQPVATFRERMAALLDEARGLGFVAIDLWLAHLEPSWATDEQIDTTRELLDERGMRVASLAGWFGSSAEMLERCCQIGRALGTDVLGGMTSLVEEDRPTLIGLLERYELRLGIENHPERSPPEMLARIGDDAGGRIGTTVDTGWYGTHGYDAARAIEELAPRLVHVHLKDVRRHGEHRTCRYGHGVVPIEGCVRALERIGYRGAISVEHEPEDYDPRAEIRENLGMLRGWLDQAA